MLDASVGGNIKLKTPEETMEFIENMAASDHAILRDRTHAPTKRSLLEFSSQDALLAQNKMLAKQLESLTETLSKLPTQLQAAQPSHSSSTGRSLNHKAIWHSRRCVGQSVSIHFPYRFCDNGH